MLVQLSQLLLTLQQADACVIQGQDSGECKAPQDFGSQMSFCSSVVKYTACVPREIPWYPNLTLAKKDAWVESAVQNHILERRAIEQGALKPSNPKMYNFWQGVPIPRFTDNSECADSYRNYMCYMAFPRCDEAGRSLLMCQSACINMMRACKYPKDMWRCYYPQYYGGEYAEGTQGDQVLNSDGEPIYYRALNPGVPFMPNKFFDGEPLAICTPALADDALGSSDLAKHGLLMAAGAIVVAGIALLREVAGLAGERD